MNCPPWGILGVTGGGNMTDPAWKLFLRTGLPQAYNFAKAREQHRDRRDNDRREKRTSDERL